MNVNVDRNIELKFHIL